MIFRKIDERMPGLPRRLSIRSLDAWSKSNPRWMSILRRGSESSALAPGYIALIAILAILLLASVALVAFFLWRRRARRAASRSAFPSMYVQERRSRRSWQQYGSEWFGKRSPAGEETRSLVAGYSSRMPSITISRPISNKTLNGPTPIFNTKQRNTLHSIGIVELPDSSQSSPEAIYDPHTRSRSRSRSNSFTDSLPSAFASRSTSPITHHASRSRDSSVSSNHSRTPSQPRPGRPLATNSYSYARNRSPSNGPSHRGTHQPANILPETDEEHNLPSTSSPASFLKSSLHKSLPPPPPPSIPANNPHKNSLSYTPSDPNNVYSDPYSSYIAQKPQFDFADYDVLHETTQVIDIAIAEPLDIPQGPLTPFGEREAKAGAALGLKSTWYKSPGQVERGTWLV